MQVLSSLQQALSSVFEAVNVIWRQPAVHYSIDDHKEGELGLPLAHFQHLLDFVRGQHALELLTLQQLLLHLRYRLSVPSCLSCVQGITSMSSGMGFLCIGLAQGQLVFVAIRDEDSRIHRGMALLLPSKAVAGQQG